MRAVNRPFTIKASGTAQIAHSVDAENRDARGLMVMLDVTENTLTLGLFVVIAARNEAGEWQQIYADGTGITTTGDFEYVFYPGAANGDFHVVAGIPIPREVRIQILRLGSGSATYSARGQWLI